MNVEEPLLIDSVDLNYKEYKYMMFMMPILLDAKCVVETGLGSGHSTKIFLEALSMLNPPRVLHTFELYPNRHYPSDQVINEINNWLKLKQGIEWKLHIMDSAKGGSVFKEPCIDLLYLDSDHAYNHIINELNSFAPFLTDKAVIFTHDSFPTNPHAHYSQIAGGNPSDTYFALKDWSKNKGWKLIALRYPEGMTILFRDRK